MRESAVENKSLYAGNPSLKQGIIVKHMEKGGGELIPVPKPSQLGIQNMSQANSMRGNGENPCISGRVSTGIHQNY